MASGPRAGFDDFVRTRSTGLLRIAYLLTGDRHAAEDLLQEVLEQMYVRWRRIEGMPEAYARRALVNRSVNRWRRRALRAEISIEGHLEARVERDHGDDVVVREAVLVALRDLPPRQRAAVVLRYLADLPVHEVSAALGCAEGTVRSNAARGLDRLREVLGSAVVPDGGER
ncbi:SigE family RNA polymerase sigma factor [Paractinoplanes atraurantiacus]|uniref:RNA polymerase sigma-70 factor, sigma-E family n=1 Tax=Paractinoplanes atraurantiacus TaxID=1036182 RepID=A0A285J4I8_9ACTN|nr:SigE family RNA polymerase sigma factor [Actinoplanes atraurantiacus]SNY55260.1 RNA polymerase sigma-70 factor, sigma-E family [Actinoplanes atraurantiacus]